MTLCDEVTHIAMGMFSGTATPHHAPPQGLATSRLPLPALPNFGGSLLYNYACTLWQRTTKFHVVTHIERGLVFNGSATHAPSQSDGRTSPTSMCQKCRSAGFFQWEFQYEKYSSLFQGLFDYFTFDWVWEDVEMVCSVYFHAVYV